MFSTLRARWILIFVTIVLATIWLLPNFVKFDKNSFLGRNKIIPGLDIQGGLHLVMGVDVQTVLQERTARTARDIEQQMKNDGIQFASVVVTGEHKEKIEILSGGATNSDAIAKFIDDRYSALLQVVSREENKIELKYFDAAMIEMKKQIVSQAIEVIRNRIDEFGVSEPSITAQGNDRILIQLPGIRDQEAARAKELINRTAKLNFRIVSHEITDEELNRMIAEAEKAGSFKFGQDGLTYSAYIKRINGDLAAKLPKNTKVVFEKAENAESLEVGRRAYVVRTDSALGGEHLEDASVRQDQMGKPEVHFRFSVEGRRLFADLTAQAAGGQLAIVLDDVIKSAPSVKEQIDSDQAVITLGGARNYQASLDEATFIATALRAGSLPAGLEQLEERTVGPTLGTDSINKAKRATIVGALAVFLFAFFYYQTAGLIANIALVLNIYFTFAILTSLGATLTLPGIAGLALTIGMAVDANVIIFERIKEELRKGSSMTASIRDGFSNAFSAIFDSNLTTILTCLVLMYYGTGPIRGFAVSLTIGITCSMFTAIFVSRTIIDTLHQKFKINILMPKKG